MSTATMSPLNPGCLKIELALKGVRLDESARTYSTRLRGEAEATPAHSLELVLPQEVWVNVPSDEPATANSPFLLSADGEQLTLQYNGSRLTVRLVPQPRFYELATTSGITMREVGTVYGPFIAINPAAACGFSLRHAPCRFCRSGTGLTIADAFPFSPRDIVEVVRAAFAEGVVDFVYFNPPYVGTEDAGVAFLEPYIDAVKKHFDTFVALQIHPPKTNQWIDRTYAMGVDALSYSVEIYDGKMLERRCAGRARHIGRDRYYDALAHAASVFPSGTVWSDLILGLEPIESTVQGVDTLVAAGVLPVLSPFRTSEGMSAPSQPPLTLEGLQPVFAHLFRAVRDAGINMGWVRDLSFGITPLEARFFAGDEARTAVAMQHFYRSRLGTLATRSLSRLRRRLRVRTVSDSFDAARL